MENYLATLVVLVVIGLVLSKILPVKRKGGNVHDNQLASVEVAEFFRKPVMNASESNLYEFLLHVVNKYHYPVRIYPQVSLGEILKTDNKSAFFAINSKRVDFVIADRDNIPCAVVEYQGAGHWQNNAKKRDAIKKLACEKAGIKYFDIPATYTGNELIPLIDFFDFINAKEG
ncbi:DUF2726 domain-containing protein (plasmid) [Serratia marcescens]|uniref:DUF2726 domain-containing protein n=1 Tax=Serratia marcescens TaxID=615 RepID=A0A6H0A1H1_SERMA|nr:DUF2726 domain-containing protein [Serratia marcescens]QHE59611.1 DUF2726 domain-containing protein [Serratia marcescens]QIS31403.1 DUF2726 domain-containing protein [Serratia marcescens]